MILVAHITSQGVPLIEPDDLPTITIHRLSDDSIVVNEQEMTEVGYGHYKYDFTEDSSLEYVMRVDADPAETGQVTALERYKWGSFSGKTLPSAAEIDTVLTTAHGAGSWATGTAAVIGEPLRAIVGDPPDAIVVTVGED